MIQCTFIQNVVTINCNPFFCQHYRILNLTNQLLTSSLLTFFDKCHLSPMESISFLFTGLEGCLIYLLVLEHYLLHLKAVLSWSVLLQCCIQILATCMIVHCACCSLYFFLFLLDFLMVLVATLLSERGDFITGTPLRQRKLFFLRWQLFNLQIFLISVRIKEKETVEAVKVGY